MRSTRRALRHLRRHGGTTEFPGCLWGRGSFGSRDAIDSALSDSDSCRHRNGTDDPEGVLDAIGFTDVTSPAGYLGSTFGLLGPALIIVLGHGSRCIGDRA
jgi:hypothetical protein